LFFFCKKEIKSRPYLLLSVLFARLQFYFRIFASNLTNIDIRILGLITLGSFPNLGKMTVVCGELRKLVTVRHTPLFLRLKKECVLFF
jgi:hypothetical protein